MKKIGDIIGQRYGNLIVIELIGKDKYYDKIWRCKCDCGNIVNVKQGHLRSGHTKSCGCNKNHLNNLINKTFGYLLVVDRAEDYVNPCNAKRYTRWKCCCDCGKEIIVFTSNLKSGSVTSCGCHNPHRLQDLSGAKFGKLTVIKQVEPYVNDSGRKLIRYKCKCECGRYIFALANTLRTNDVMSCGCSVNSKGELAVAKWLTDNGIEYEMHKSFSDCLSNNGYRLNFDFFLKEKNVLIECNGIQHYEAIDFFGGKERLKQQQLHDKIKAEYAYKKNISYLVLDCRPNMLSTINDKLCDFFSKC